MSGRLGRIAISAVAIVIAGAVVVGTWFLATQFQSPQQREAAAAPPSARPVLYSVTRGNLSEETTVLAQAVRQGEYQVPLAAAEGTAVITATGVNNGDTVNSGSVLTWINGRPVIALKGSFPLYRDFGEGDKGDDVRLLQQALADLGYDIQTSGEFGPYTAAAVKSLYQTIGAEPATRAAAPAATAAPQGGQSGAQTTRTQEESQSEDEILIRASEIAVIPNLPAVATKVPAQGQVLGGEESSITLGATGITLTAQAPADSAQRFTKEVTARATIDGKDIALKVDSVAPPQDPEKDSAYTVTFVAAGEKIPSNVAGQKDIIVTVDLSKPLDNVFLVPQRAIAADAQGNTTVLREEENGAFTQIPVKERQCVGGMCAIEGEGISEGVRVKVDN
ncbi:MAG: peptidoglycan-binding domain-containing protein [Actinomycetaceae bacterium]|nr:peptidoglycan-binding domain-containing protein [Actinomycetaceae bacterium]